MSYHNYNLNNYKKYLNIKLQNYNKKDKIFIDDDYTKEEYKDSIKDILIFIENKTLNIKNLDFLFDTIFYKLSWLIVKFIHKYFNKCFNIDDYKKVFNYENDITRRENKIIYEIHELINS